MHPGNQKVGATSINQEARFERHGKIEFHRTRGDPKRELVVISQFLCLSPTECVHHDVFLRQFSNRQESGAETIPPSWNQREDGQASVQVLVQRITFVTELLPAQATHTIPSAVPGQFLLLHNDEGLVCELMVSKGHLVLHQEANDVAAAVRNLHLDGHEATRGSHHRRPEGLRVVCMEVVPSNAILASFGRQPKICSPRIQQARHLLRRRADLDLCSEEIPPRNL
mmetsp:Transcript_96458/g.241894  ORF Transcript_96458/g.241894 Transcript_96458/m.241894 type:complete len:226 (+) Transcript_96458:1003-1680(+)